MTLSVIVIGGGPGGLTTLKTLAHFPRANSSAEPAFDPILLECSDRVGGTFDQRSYENGALVSSKQLTSFSDFRYPLDFKDHPTMGEYVQYLERYVTRFGLDQRSGTQWKGTAAAGSRINLHCRVTRMEKLPGGRHRVTYDKTLATGTVESCSLECDAVAICSGLHVTPAVPNIPGIENLVAQSPPVLSSLVATPPILPTLAKAGEQPVTLPSALHIPAKEGVRIIHSSQYKNRAEFNGRRVMILGMGETGMDLCYEAIKSTASEVVVCHRGGFLSFPKVLNDFKVFGVKFDGELPIDGLITNLFETAYVHRWLSGSHFRWHFSDMIIKKVLLFLTGTEAGCNQWVGSLPPARLGRAYVFLNKSSKALPYINRPYKPAYRFLANVLGTEYIDPPEDAGSDRVIDLALWPSSIDADGRVHFSSSADLPQGGGIYRKEEERMNKRVVKPDMIVFATGYKQEWSWLDAEYPQGPSHFKTNVRELCDAEDPTVAFLGFVRPGVGAIPPIAETQAMLWSLLLLNKVALPTTEPHYRLLTTPSSRIQYGVDHSAYMSTLANDIGASPSILQLYKNHGAHVTLCYCFGAAFVSFYRLEGPFKSSEVDDIVKTEIWETITRRGLVGNLFMGLIPMMFYGVLNGLALLAEVVWILTLRPFFSFSVSDAGKASKTSTKMM